MALGPWTKETHAHMRKRQGQCLAAARDNRNETWMLEKLQRTGLKWTRQRQWNWRLLDFWCHELGIGVEVDGPEHNSMRDRQIDSRMLWRSGILVLRVRNQNERDAARAMEAIASSETWDQRRRRFGVPLTKSERHRT